MVTSIWSADSTVNFDQVFDVVGSRFGKVLQSAKMSSCSRIVDRVDISWRGNLFHVWIDEDVGEWVPDCVEVFDDEEVLDDGNRSNGEEELEMGEIWDNEVVEENAHVLTDGDVDVQNNTEPLTNAFPTPNEESTVVRKKFRRRHFFKNRGESSGSHERPKKRQRDNNDPFGLDGIIGIMSVNTPQQESNERDANFYEGFVTPDLNSNVPVCEEGGDGVEGLEHDGHGSHMGFVKEKVTINVETEKTISLGRALGVEEIEDFASDVQEVLRSEGYQVGDQ
ncbi:hypothetical protein Hanom_Chr14g01252511 [Helianthus anomalus]